MVICGSLAVLPDDFMVQREDETDREFLERQNRAVAQVRVIDEATLKTCEARRKRLEDELKTYR